MLSFTGASAPASPAPITPKNCRREFIDRSFRIVGLTGIGGAAAIGCRLVGGVGVLGRDTRQRQLREIDGDQLLERIGRGRDARQDDRELVADEPAVRVLYHEDVKNAPDPEAKERELIAYYRERFFNPYRAADVGQVDEVIEPRETRQRVISALEMLQNKRDSNPPKKHGNMPL